MVPSRAEERIIERMLSGKEPIIVTESIENVVDTTRPPVRAIPPINENESTNGQSSVA